jgi:hypothetical protein
VTRRLDRGDHQRVVAPSSFPSGQLRRLAFLAHGVASMLAIAFTPVNADEALFLTWGACALDPSSAHDQAFDCSNNTENHVLYVAFTLAQPADSVLGAEVVVDVQVAAGGMPDWWRFGAGDCRANALKTDVAFGGSVACADPWAGLATASLPGYTIGMPRGGAAQARIKVGIGVPPNQPRTLAAGTPYNAVRLVLTSTRTDSCSGCPSAACLVLNSILLNRSPAAVGGNRFVSTPAPGAGNWATWQGTGADCAAVPVRRTSWGSIKSLYR